MSAARILDLYRFIFTALIIVASIQTLVAMQGEWPTRFLLYAASAMLIVTLDRTLLRSH